MFKFWINLQTIVVATRCQSKSYEISNFTKFMQKDWIILYLTQVASTDIEEGMRVGVDRNKYQIHIPLPPKIDPSVTMMQVEEKPDVTYSDVGGCKEQIDKLREVLPYLWITSFQETARADCTYLHIMLFKPRSHPDGFYWVMDPHPSQRTGLQHAVWQPQHEVPRPNARFKPPFTRSLGRIYQTNRFGLV